MEPLTLISLIIFGALVYLLQQNVYKNSSLKDYFIPSLVFKLLSGIALGIMYKYHYGFGDTWTYMSDASILSDLFWNDHSNYLAFLWGNAGLDKLELAFQSQPRALLLVKIVSVFSILTSDNYWVSTLFFSLFSFYGCWLFAVTLIRYFPQLKAGVILGLLFYPSVVFWGSGIIKESVAIGALMLCLSCFINLIYGSKNRPQHLVCFLVFYVLLWKIKYYIAAILALAITPTFLVFIAAQYWDIRKYRFWIWLSILLLFSSLVSQLHPNFYVSRFLHVVVNNHNLYFESNNSGGSIMFYELTPTVGSILLNSPLAIISSLFRPLIFEANNSLQLIQAIENTFLLIWLIGRLISFRKLWNDKHLYLFLSAMVFILALSAFLALSTPNFGTLSRYRVMFLPLVLIISGHSQNVLVNKMKVIKQYLMK